MAQISERSLQHNTNKPSTLTVEGMCSLAISYWFNTGEDEE